MFIFKQTNQLPNLMQLVKKFFFLSIEMKCEKFFIKRKVQKKLSEEGEKFECKISLND